MFFFSLRKYRPNIERIKRDRQKYSRYLGPDKRTQMIMHKVYINSKVSKLKVVHVTTFKEKRTFFTNRSRFEQFGGVYWENKKGINTIFAKFEVDVVFADRYGAVLDVVKSAPKGFISKYYKDGWIVMLVPKGTLNVVPINKGDIIKIWNRHSAYKG